MSWLRIEPRCYWFYLARTNYRNWWDDSQKHNTWRCRRERNLRLILAWHRHKECVHRCKRHFETSKREKIEQYDERFTVKIWFQNRRSKFKKQIKGMSLPEQKQSDQDQPGHHGKHLNCSTNEKTREISFHARTRTQWRRSATSHKRVLPCPARSTRLHLLESRTKSRVLPKLIPISIMGRSSTANVTWYTAGKRERAINLIHQLWMYETCPCRVELNYKFSTSTTPDL